MLDFNDIESPIETLGRFDRDVIRDCLLGQLERVLFALFPNGHRRRDTFLIGDVHGNAGESLEVIVEGAKVGLWTDRATGEGGDIFKLIAEHYGLSVDKEFPQVLEKAASLVHGAEITPVRPRPKEPPIDDLGPATGMWRYEDGDGQLIAIVRRFDPPGGRKQYRTWDVRRRRISPPEPRPLFNQPALRAASLILLVEGEKASTALNSLGFTSTSAMNGAAAPVEKTDWTALRGKDVVVWPDNDAPGQHYAQAAAQALLAAGARSCQILVPPNDAAPGWDAADAALENFDIDQFISRGPRIPITLSRGDPVPTVHPAVAPKKIELRRIADIVAEQRSVKWLLPRILEAEVLAVMAGKRGTFKSFIALDWLMRIAQSGKPVVLLSGEGGGLDRRVDAWMRTYGSATPIESLPVLALERAVNLNLQETLQDLGAAIDAANIQPAAIVVDTFSKFSGNFDENSNSEVAAFLTNLGSSLRDRYQATVLLITHTGHGDPKRPRGASALSANSDAEFIIERLDGSMTVSVSRERFKDGPSLEPLVYAAESVDLGRRDDLGDRVTSLILRQTEAPAPRIRGVGINQNKGLTALREWARSKPDDQHISSFEIAALLKAQGIARQRRPDILNFLTNARVITASIGGYLLHREML